MHTVKVVFQGGGARLPALIAAAEVLSEFEKQVQISHIYGVSAGSIAGCMLATKSSMATYREKTRRAGENVLRNLPKLPKGRFMLGSKIISGTGGGPAGRGLDLCRKAGRDIGRLRGPIYRPSHASRFRTTTFAAASPLTIASTCRAHAAIAARFSSANECL
jgi:hypothetical protein